jgi:hypothetical protein
MTVVRHSNFADTGELRAVSSWINRPCPRFPRYRVGDHVDVVVATGIGIDDDRQLTDEGRVMFVEDSGALCRTGQPDFDVDRRDHRGLHPSR